MIPLAQYALFETRDPDQAREMVAEKFCPHSLQRLDTVDRFHARHHLVRGAMVSINYIQYGATVLIDPGELGDFYLIQIPISGSAQIGNGASVVDSDIRSGSILNPDRKTRMIWSAGCRQLIIYIAQNEIAEFAQRMIGRSISQPLVFDPHIDFRRREIHNWRRKVLAMYAAADEKRLFCAASRLQQKMIEEQLIGEFLWNQPSNISQFYSNRPEPHAVGYVNRARRYIIDNAHRSIALSDIARAADVSVRALQYGFHRTYAQSPIQALRKERLMRVRSELASGHCQSSVSRIAAKWGMPHFGRFAQYYFSEFGELPSATKTNANRNRFSVR